MILIYSWGVCWGKNEDTKEVSPNVVLILLLLTQAKENMEENITFHQYTIKLLEFKAIKLSI